MCLMQLSNTYQYLEHEDSHKLRETDVLETSKSPRWALSRQSKISAYKPCECRL